MQLTQTGSDVFVSTYATPALTVQAPYTKAVIRLNFFTVGS